MLNHALARRRFWAYAAVFGAAWGSVEITIGAFLHSLHLPFSGSALAGLGVALLVAERQLLPARGLTLATGLAAAACKSLSPGGVIFGPMLGIGGEALLVELALAAWPRARGSAVLAGALTALWPVTQKLLTQYVLFGRDIISLYIAGLEHSASWLGAASGTEWRVLLGVLALLVTIGTACALGGHKLGRDAARILGARGVCT